MHVLIVEDEFLLADTLRSTFTDAGHTVMGPVGSVAKALAMLESSTPDVAVIDANLHSESSEPVAAALNCRNIPFLVYSGYDHRHLPGVLQGAPFISKPFNSGQLLKTIERIAQ